MFSLLDWLATHESSLSAIAAIIAIIAGLAVVVRLAWTRMPGQLINNIKRPAFLSDWRNIALMVVSGVAVVLALLFTFATPNQQQTSESAAETSKVEGKPSVAVLPLDNISGDPDQSFLADGIADDVITLLSRNPRLFVVARNSSFTYRGQAMDMRQIGEELGVRYVVEGSLRKIGERIRVNIQLIDTNDGLHLWAEKYDRAYTDLFALQDEITNGIALALGDQIFQAEIARASSTPTDNLDAWGLVMRANQAVSTWSSKSSEQAEALFRQALQRDPNYAIAQAELARTLCWRAVNQWSINPEQAFAEGYQLGEQALQLAPNDPLVLYGVGACYGVKATHAEKGIRLLKKAVDLQPSFASAQGMLGIAYTFNGEPEQALSPGAESLRLEPRSPNTWLLAIWYAATLNELGRFEEAESMARSAIASYDGWWFTHLHLAVARAGQNDIEGAQQALYMAREKDASFSLAKVKSAAAFAWKDKGKNMLALLEPIWPEDLLTADKN